MLPPVTTTLCDMDPTPKEPNSSLAVSKLEPASSADTIVAVWVGWYSLPMRSRRVPPPAGSRFARSSANVRTALFAVAS